MDVFYYNISKRIEFLLNYYYKGVERKWSNPFTPFTTGTLWDDVYDETSNYIVPEKYEILDKFRTSLRLSAHPVTLPDDFWSHSLVERRSWFIKEAIVNYMPQEVLPGELIAGARFNMMASRCLNEEEAAARNELIYGPDGVREREIEFHYRGFGNCTTASGHLIPNHQEVIEKGFRHIYEDLEEKYGLLTEAEKNGPKGNQLRAMMNSATMPRELAARYSALCLELSREEKDNERKKELEMMAENLKRVPWEGARNFWEAVQSLWISHMLIMTDENYPGPGISFGRIDQYLYPYWEKSIKNGMTEDFGKEILKCFWIHCNTAYDATIYEGNNQGITSGFGQLLTISGVGKDGQDMSNDLTYVLLDVIDDMSPILEPKPSIRLHRKSPDKLLDKVVDMLSDSQGAPFLINFDERSMAGLLREAKMSNNEHLINLENVYDYASVGCLENTMVGNDRSGTVDNNLYLSKVVELTLCNGGELHTYDNKLSKERYEHELDSPKTGNPEDLKSFEQFYHAFETQMCYIIKKNVELYDALDTIRATYCPTPYLSCLVKGCAEKGLDITQGGAQIKFTTVEGVQFATTVDSLLAVKYLVYDKKICTLSELKEALQNNWEGYEVLRSQAKFRAPKYGRDDDEADALAEKVMALWSNEVWKYKTTKTKVQFRPGMLSWNYWITTGYFMAATPDGRRRGEFFSNAICPVDGADIEGPTANVNSVGKALGGRKKNLGDFEDYINYLPNGASHTMTLSPALMRDKNHKEKFKAFLRGYIENGGTALQINILDVDMLKDAQKHPENYRNLLVRVTGYNAYFASIGKELQDEIIARESHSKL